MNKRQAWLTAGLAAGAAGAVVARQMQIARAEQSAWERRRRPALDVLACPMCQGPLALNRCPGGDAYQCPACRRHYPVVGGIAHFLQPAELTGSNQQFAGLYDWFSWLYRAFSVLAFAYIGMPEAAARREITDRLQPAGGPVLEVSIGPGVNLPYLVGRPDAGDIFGLDISRGQLHRCRAYVAHQGWPVQLQLGSAERLPYRADTFGGVFHVGGINFFNDKRQAIAEMIRVARPTARILICDETEKGARAFDRMIPGFNGFGGQQRPPIEPPVDLVPPEMEEVRVFDAWKGWLYCLEFRKPARQEAV